MTRARDDSVREESRRTWADRPAGSAFAPGLEPGTREFFETVLERRFAHETPWLMRHLFDRDLAGCDVLEVGCGAGYDAYMFCRAGARYTGVDLTPDNVERTRRHLAIAGHEGLVQVGDAERLDHPDERFDLYFSNGVLHHVPDLGRALAEAYRVLRPGGRLLVVVYHRDSLFYWLFVYAYHYLWRHRRRRSLASILSEIEYNTVEARPLVRVYSRRQLREAVSAAGFRDVRLSVEKFRREDVPHVLHVDRLLARLPERALDAIGRRLGWYLLCEASRPAAG